MSTFEYFLIKKKKIFDTPGHQNYTAIFRLLFWEIFVVLNIPGKDLKLSLCFLQIVK